MKTACLFILLSLLSCTAVLAQDDLFGVTKEPARKGFVFAVNGSLDMPAADMAKRFGNSYRIGPALMYKTRSNFMFGVKADFILGNQLREDSLLAGVRDKDGYFLSSGGQRYGVGLFERGYAIGLQGGKIFPTGHINPNTGILLLTGIGFMQHKINITDDDKTIPQVRDEYKKGYDRLTNGIYLEQFAGFSMFDKGGLINFHIGLDIMAGFTQGRRDWLFDVRRKDDASRLDILFGIRGGIYLPLFKKNSEEIYID